MSFCCYFGICSAPLLHKKKSFVFHTSVPIGLSFVTAVVHPFHLIWNFALFSTSWRIQYFRCPMKVVTSTASCVSPNFHGFLRQPSLIRAGYEAYKENPPPFRRGLDAFAAPLWEGFSIGQYVVHMVVAVTRGGYGAVAFGDAWESSTTCAR